MEESKKEVAQEVTIQEQLTKNEMECIFRHLRMFVKTDWQRQEDVHDACYDCGKYCSDIERVVDPWSAFFKLAEIVKLPFVSLLTKQKHL